VTSKPFERIAADSNVVLSAAVARAAARVFRDARGLQIVTTEANVEEIQRHLPALAQQYELEEDAVIENLRVLPLKIFPAVFYESHISEAARHLGRRAPKDVPLAALALKLQVPIWSNDRDFEELPLIVYPTARLLKVLGL
jgi:predicted nucleic acid-binding protein